MHTQVKEKPKELGGEVAKAQQNIVGMSAHVESKLMQWCKISCRNCYRSKCKISKEHFSMESK